jgi:hypothetical protein
MALSAHIPQPTLPTSVLYPPPDLCNQSMSSCEKPHTSLLTAQPCTLFIYCCRPKPFDAQTLTLSAHTHITPYTPTMYSMHR